MTEPDRALPWSLGLAAAGLLWRVRLAGIYWGHEEEDWGNLEIVRGVLDSQWAYVETEHMPLFAWLAAALARALGDVHLAALIVPIGMGALAVGLTTWIGFRWLSPAAGILAGLLLCFQPEAALYSATPLRESLYMAAMLGGVLLFGSGRHLEAGGVLAVAFLARFNIAFSILPAMLLWALRGPEQDRRRVLGACAIVGSTVLAWAAWYHAESDSGSWAFWGRVVSVNTGDAVADLFPAERIAATAGALGGLLGYVLPKHVGWAVVPLAVLGALAVLRGEGLRPRAGRWLLLCGAGTLALLGTTAVLTTYDRHHNLYWKWLTPSVPYLVLFGSHGAVLLLQRLPHRARGRRLQATVVGGGLALATALGYIAETRSQLQRSDFCYGTQVRTVRWMEEGWDSRAAVLTAGIPWSWLHRHQSPIRSYRWDDPAIPHEDPAELGRWLQSQRIGLVMWYRSPELGAVEAAGYLADGASRAAGPVRLVPVLREDGYGMIVYEVLGAGVPTAQSPPPETRPLPEALRTFPCTLP